MRIIQRNQMHILGGCQIGHRGGGSARSNEGSVNLSVLQVIGTVAKAAIGGSDVRFGQAIDTQHIHCIEIHTGAGGTNGHTLALQIGYGLDILVQGNNLHLLGVEVGYGGEAIHLLGEQPLAVICIGHHIGLAECQFRVASLQLLHIGLGTVTHQAGDLNALGIICSMLGNYRAECIVSTGLAAGDKAHLCGASGAVTAVPAAAGNQSQQHDQRQNKSHKLFHNFSPYLIDFYPQIDQ